MGFIVTDGFEVFYTLESTRKIANDHIRLALRALAPRLEPAPLIYR
jgi:hypothetical protein